MMKLAVWIYMHILNWHIKLYPKGGWIWCPRWLQTAVWGELARRGARPSPLEMGDPNVLYWAKDWDPSKDFQCRSSSL